eukprot:TRINITY_DN915_c0_g1_i4.p1 TRINITY_DN915_c0_g1~~TRINITY_DN915_c0_g1_i4.p1  ORF type:complete len:270 (+),score=35.36 TRINITY_DN915_c0_g1_i4:92-901(+)
MESAQESARTPEQHTLSIFGVGNIGSAIARGILYSKIVEPTQVTLTRRHIDPLKNQFTEGVNITGNNTEAAKSKVLFLCVPPAQLNELIDEIKSVVKEGQVVVSIVSGAEISDIENRFGNASLDIIRAMPNTAIAFRESMTCLSSKNPKSEGMELVKRIFDALGSTMIVEEKQMVPATALCACGIAFFLQSDSCRVARRYRNWLSLGRRDKTRRSDCQRRCDVVVGVRQPSRKGSGQGDDTPRLHHRRSQSDGALGLFKRFHQRHRDFR